MTDTKILSIKQCEEYLENLHFNQPQIEAVLMRVKRNIKFLESIYMTGGEYHHCFSDDFNSAATTERERLCNFSSACHNILRRMK